MPELPEVETIVRDLRMCVTGRSFGDIEVIDSRVIRNCAPRVFVNRLKNQTIVELSRVGKAVILRLSGGGYLTIQPMMSGKLIYSRQFVPLDPPNSTKIIFKFSGGEYLQYNDVRMFGRVNLLKSLNELKFFNTLGPDPLSNLFTSRWIGAYVRCRTASIKTLLMDQHFIAGIGNIYASEILFRSRINPARPGCSLEAAEVKRLHRNTVVVLKEAVDSRGTSMRTYRDTRNEKGGFVDRLKVYDRENEHCFHCNQRIQKIVQAGRSTYFCRRCQG